jgi:hypothetical protein
MRAGLSVDTAVSASGVLRSLQADYSRQVSLGRGHAQSSGKCNFQL